jgi:hypothetical protein
MLSKQSSARSAGRLGCSCVLVCVLLDVHIDMRGAVFCLCTVLELVRREPGLLHSDHGASLLGLKSTPRPHHTLTPMVLLFLCKGELSEKAAHPVRQWFSKDGYASSAPEPRAERAKGKMGQTHLRLKGIYLKGVESSCAWSLSPEIVCRFYMVGIPQPFKITQLLCD